MEVIIKIKSIFYYIWYRKQVNELKDFCKNFIDSNLTTITVSCLYSEKAVGVFYKRILEFQSQLEPQLISLYEAELDKYSDFRKAINHSREISRNVKNIINNEARPLSLYRYIHTAGSFEEYVNEKHKFVISIFNKIECDLHKIFERTNEDNL